MCPKPYSSWSPFLLLPYPMHSSPHVLTSWCIQFLRLKAQSHRQHLRLLSLGQQVCSLQPANSLPLLCLDYCCGLQAAKLSSLIHYPYSCWRDHFPHFKWLPVAYRIKFKFNSILESACHGAPPVGSHTSTPSCHTPSYQLHTATGFL